MTGKDGRPPSSKSRKSPVIWAPVSRNCASADLSPRNVLRNFFQRFQLVAEDLQTEEVSKAVKLDFFCNALKNLEKEMAAWVILQEPKTFVEAHHLAERRALRILSTI